MCADVAGVLPLAKMSPSPGLVTFLAGLGLARNVQANRRDPQMFLCLPRLVERISRWESVFETELVVGCFGFEAGALESLGS